MTADNPLNQDFSRFDQVRKSHTYRLAEHESDEFDEDYEIATLDLGLYLRGDARDKARFAEAFGAALREIGFAVLVGHGVDPALYDDMHDAILDLFTATPLDEKMRFRAKRHGSVSQGYFPIEETSEIHPDLVEAGSGAVAPSTFCKRAPSRSAPGITGRAPVSSLDSAASRSPTRPCSSRSPGRCSRGWAATPMPMTTSSPARISACARTIIHR